MKPLTSSDLSFIETFMQEYKVRKSKYQADLFASFLLHYKNNEVKS